MYSPLPLLALVASLLLPASLSGMPGATDTTIALVGRVFPADLVPTSQLELRLFVRGGSFSDSVIVDSAGHFFLPLPADLAGDTVELVVDAADPAQRSHHPALVRLGREGLAAEQRIVLVPRWWTIPSGTYAGRSVPISPQRAAAAVCAGCAGFYPRPGSTQAAAGQLRSWPESVFPLRVAFDRDNSDQAITRADSLAFWRTVSALEADFGEQIFRPARYVETLSVGDDAPSDVVLVWIVPSMRWAGLGTRGYSGQDVNFAAVWIRGTSLLRGPEGPAVLTHELIHALGYGHTCSWRSVMAIGEHCPSQKSDTATPYDIAYVQVARRVRALQQEHGARWGIAAAQEGERTILLGLSERGERPEGR